MPTPITFGSKSAYSFGFGRVQGGDLPENVTVSYLVVAGGAGGGSLRDVSPGQYGGGGGAGQVVTGTVVLTTPFAISVTVGAGGIGVASDDGRQGSDSILTGVATALGGHGGGVSVVNGPAFPGHGGAGCGGGGGGAVDLVSPGSGGVGTVSSGSAGGVNGGGGGGAGGSSSGAGAAGGPGVISSISGSSIEYGRGGNTASLDARQPGQGGAGAVSAPTDPGESGQNGVVIVRYLTGAITATGGTITADGLYTIHTFTGNGTFAST